MWWISLLACQGPAGDGLVEGTCIEEPRAAEGNTLTLGDATLQIPADVVLDGEVVSLCAREPENPDIVGSVWTVGPDRLVLTSPASIRIAHGGDDGSVTLIVPGSNGPVPQFSREVPEPGVVRGSLMRPGDVYVERDGRVTVPYTAIGAADVLFVVGNYDTMWSHQSRLRENFGPLWNDLEGLGLDLHVGLTTADMTSTDETLGHQGHLRSAGTQRWIDSSTPDPIGTFRDMADVLDGPFLVEALAATEAALREPANRGFEREDASLAVVFFARLGDAERGPPASQLINFIRSRKALPARAIVHGVYKGDEEGAMAEVVQGTGGGSADIDSSRWPAAFGPLVERLQEDASMLLTGPIDEDSIEVWWSPEGEDPRQLTATDVAITASVEGVRVSADLVGRTPSELTVRYREL